ncbi:hypothetical protein QS306_13685 [Paraburkholderia bonniea]|uniref:hypothetical protein n=1 Tax=Paraburkholderia bonniea TaxID=2152891 RepID=UPI0015807A4F|nr:hypothetical protein [Paraburkholderia bonniea]WJF91826.1 hypothetical protein QS306_13685 [Paraburkholderia bonniea]WJF95145.1 hypothetical protein QS308_13695 [Paraburkholderia bonniea]
MDYPAGSNRASRDKKAELDLADETRAKQRKQDAKHIDSKASKWRYQPVPHGTKTPY